MPGGNLLLDRGLFFLLRAGKLVDQLFHEEFFYVDIKGKAADEGEELKGFPVLLRRVLEGLSRCAVHFCDILSQMVDPGFLQAAHLLINRCDVKILPVVKIFLCERLKERLDIFDGEDIFKIVDKDQDQHMLLGVFLFHRRGEEIVLCIVVDHGLRQYLVLAVPAGGAELALHAKLKVVYIQEVSIMADKAITAEQMRHYDSYTINTIGIPSLVLMERAALAVRDEVLNAFPLNLQNIVVVAGSGNNGGDGLDVARLLHIAGVKVTILNVGNPDHASNEHQVQDRICQYYKIPQTSDLNVLKDASLIVDALFGIGIDRPVEGNYATAIEAINNSDAVVVAVDMPSGINTDTGEVMGVAVNATATVTFAVNKVGLTKSAGKKHAGRVVVASDMGTYPVDD